ncbi:hypothetical protein KVT40_003543 [Elsinoe batatas]|uniref:Uncharacterized protein n=1 Tax=Elsinoe batatas TaxID=2601811 RepID=A0A8K0LCH7_9PEZI|nr:hypothetical protein KVT40_003543 [Elsinoe batatas]
MPENPPFSKYRAFQFKRATPVLARGIFVNLSARAAGYLVVTSRAPAQNGIPTTLRTLSDDVIVEGSTGTLQSDARLQTLEREHKNVKIALLRRLALECKKELDTNLKYGVQYSPELTRRSDHLIEISRDDTESLHSEPEQAPGNGRRNLDDVEHAAPEDVEEDPRWHNVPEDVGIILDADGHGLAVTDAGLANSTTTRLAWMEAYLALRDAPTSDLTCIICQLDVTISAPTKDLR